MVNGTRSPGTDQRPSLGALVADIVIELRALIRGEVELAKAELRDSVRSGATGGGLIAAAVGLLVMVGLLFTWAIVYGLSEGAGLPLWASFLIVGTVYLLIAVLLGYLGVRSLKQAKGPEQAMAEMQRTKEIVSSIPPNTPPVPTSPGMSAGTNSGTNSGANSGTNSGANKPGTGKPSSAS